jgi:hypothetical protein
MVIAAENLAAYLEGKPKNQVSVQKAPNNVS